MTGQHVLNLAKFAEEDLHDLLTGPNGQPDLGGWLGAYGRHLASPGNKILQEQWHQTIEKVSDRLWTGLVGRVHERLNHHGLDPDAPIVIIPQGGSALLPLHVASPNDQWEEAILPG